eukprot:gene6905-11067_t
MDKQNLQSTLPNSTLPKTDDFIVSQQTQGSSSNPSQTQGSFGQKFQFPYNGQNQTSPGTTGLKPGQTQTLNQQPLTQQQLQGHFTTQTVNMSKQQTYNPQNTEGGNQNEDVDSDGEKEAPKKARRRKIKIEYIKDKSKRHITFSKRKGGIMKKVYELSTLTGTQALLLVASETGHVYTFATPKLQPLITKIEGKNLIQACLNAPDNAPEDEEGEEEEEDDEQPMMGDLKGNPMNQQQMLQQFQQQQQQLQQQQLQQQLQQQQQMQQQQQQYMGQQSGSNQTNMNAFNPPVMRISMNQQGQNKMNQYNQDN